MKFDKANIKICVVGLGYVGLPLVTRLGKSFSVIGYDINEKKIAELKEGRDRNGETSKKLIVNKNIDYTDDPKKIASTNFIIITVPTPVDEAKRPDLEPIIKACQTIGQNLSPGSIIVLESTVYPGVTEEICVPVLEKSSGLKYMKDFKVGYSPERINPGDKVHTVDKIVKVVSGCDNQALSIIKLVYSRVTEAGTFSAKSIMVAEAAKVIENTQRDINIALMNELKLIFDRLDIDINDVLAAAKTKWNFLYFYPGLVGGHCIGVDPYYLAEKAKMMGIYPEMILAGRKVNDSMAKYHASKILRSLIKKNILINKAKILILGATFKPDVKDIRNSKVKDLANELESYGCQINICDPMLAEARKIFNYKNIKLDSISKEKYDFVILAVKHKSLEKVKFDYQI